MSDISVLKPSGHIWVFPEFGKTLEADTLCCAHCGAHWIVQRGSGRKRGFCMRCNKVTCGQRKCDACIPLERYLENCEKGLPKDHRIIVVGT